MNNNKLSRSWKYWLYALIGFILLYWITLSFPKWAYTGDYDTLEEVRQHNVYLLLEGIACAVVAYLFSFSILIYFEKKWNWSHFERNVVIKLILLFLIVQILYSIIIWPILGKFLLLIYSNEEHFGPFTLVKKIANTPYFAFRFLGWFWVVFIYYGYGYLKNTLLRQYQLEATLTKSQMDSLKSQINPHFMFNSLNNIKGLMLEDVNKSRVMLTKLSEMLRFSLNMDQQNFIPLKKELEIIDNYIALSKIQFEERLNYSRSFNDIDLEFLIPPMMIQLLIENAVKHGINNLKNGGVVSLIIENIDNVLNIEVRNTGKIEYDSNSTKVGLTNIKKRLEFLYGNKATFSLQELNSEVVATLKLPMA